MRSRAPMRRPGAQADAEDRLACGAPPSVLDRSLSGARVRARKLVVARVLGGADYWRYGVDELAALARRSGVKVALLPGDPAPRRSPR